MDCPNCQLNLSELDIGLQVLACEKCRAVWFSQGQLEQMDWDHEELTRFIGDAPEREVEKIYCSCCDIPMHYGKYPTAPQVLSAKCYGCSGSFLFDFQMREIRDHSMNEQQREAYLNQLVNTVPGFLEAETLRKTNPGPQGFAKKWLDFKTKYLYFGKNK